MKHPIPKWEARFWSKVNMLNVNGCWLWTGTVTDQGYGCLSIGGKKIRAHRLAYRLCVGYIPAPLTVDHKCNIRLCVNPSHMEIKTASENASRAWKINPNHGGKGCPKKTHCRRGHPYQEAHRIPSPSGGWKNWCKTCAHDRYIKSKNRKNQERRDDNGRT